MASNPPTISNLPATPDRADRPTFSARCVALFDALKNAFVGEANALAAWMKGAADEVQTNASATGNAAANASGYAGLAQDWATKTSGEVVAGQGYGAKKYAQDAAAAAASALNAPGTSATSTSSIAIGTGSKTFSIQPGKAFAVGQFVVAAKTGAPANYIGGQITTHDSAAGLLTINGTKVGGSGTHADWMISLGPDSNSASIGANTFTGDQNLSGNRVVNAKLKNTNDELVALGNWIGSMTWDVSRGDAFTATVTGNCTVTLTGFPASGIHRAVMLYLTNGGAYTITFSVSAMKYPGGTAPALTVSGRDDCWLTTRDGGATCDFLVAKDIK